MAEIATPEGKTILLDEADLPIIAGYKWHARAFPPQSGRWYAVAFIPGTRNRKVRMHRLLLSAPQDVLVDHRNGNGLDNRRCNIRFATYGLNRANARVSKNNKSGLKGVCWNPTEKKWIAHIASNGRFRILGRFTDKEQAARAYDAAARACFGEFARCNFPQEGEVAV